MFIVSLHSYDVIVSGAARRLRSALEALGRELELAAQRMRRFTDAVDREVSDSRFVSAIDDWACEPSPARSFFRSAPLIVQGHKRRVVWTTRFG